MLRLTDIFLMDSAPVCTMLMLMPRLINADSVGAYSSGYVKMSFTVHHAIIRSAENHSFTIIYNLL